MQQQQAGEGTARPGRARRAVRWVFGALRNYFAVVGLLVTLLPVLFALALSKGAAPAPAVEIADATPLALDLSGKIAEREPGFEAQVLRKFFGGEREVYLPEIRSALKKAAADTRIIALDVRFGMLAASPSEYAELRRLLADFRASGKTVRVLLDHADDWSYYAASAADRIVLSPANSIDLTGPTFHLVYFGSALKKIGVDIDVVRAGKYKSAFEPFVADEPTAPTLEEYHAMQGSLRDHVIQAVAAGRGKDPAVVDGWYKQSIFTSSEAMAAGIVDALGYETTEETPAGRDDDDIVTVSEYGDATTDRPGPQSEDKGKGGIALIEAVGEISMAPGSEMSDADVITPDPMREEIRWAMGEDDVKAVVLRVSSPGGSAVASDIIWHELKALAAKKPVVVSMGAYAASGGYYISAPATRIVAEPTTITGSIGVIGMLPSAASFKEKYGVSFYVVTGSDRAALLNMGERATAEDMKLVDGTIADVYATFLTKVADGRKMDVKKVEELAQGRVYTGVEALALGLVDELGGMQVAFDAAKELAGFDKTKLYPVIRYQGKHMSLKECLRNPGSMMKCLSQADSRLMLPRQPGALPEEAERVAARLAHWSDAKNQGRALALWPAYLGVKW